VLLSSQPTTVIQISASNGAISSLLLSRTRTTRISPWIVIIVRIRLLKGWREDDSKEKLFFLYPEGDGNRSSCPVMAFLALALEDGVFADVSTIEEILFPAIGPTLWQCM